MQDALGLKKMTAFMADNDLESGTDGESNSRDKRIPKANAVDAFSADVVNFAYCGINAL